MPVVEQAITSILEASTSVTSLASTRIYPVELPQDPQLPAVVYNVISEQRESVMSQDTGTVHARVQVSCWAPTYTSASGLSEGVRSATQRYSSTSIGGVLVHEIFIENRYVFRDEETGEHAHTLDLIVHYEE